MYLPLCYICDVYFYCFIFYLSSNLLVCIRATWKACCSTFPSSNIICSKQELMDLFFTIVYLLSSTKLNNAKNIVKKFRGRNSSITFECLSSQNFITVIASIFLLKSKLDVLSSLNKHGIIIHNLICCSYYLSAFSWMLYFAFLKVFSHSLIS